jgi:hypothetical protein
MPWRRALKKAGERDHYRAALLLAGSFFLRGARIGRCRVSEAAQTPRAAEVLARAVKATTDAALLAGSRAVKVAAVGDVEVARVTRSAGASVCCDGATERAHVLLVAGSQSISAGGTASALPPGFVPSAGAAVGTLMR